MVLTQQYKGCTDYHMDTLFPYHYGSHATDYEMKYIGVKFFVSIPLWFSRNSLKELVEYVEAAVSIPLWFSRNVTEKSAKT